MASKFLYHYTDRHSAADIIEAGAIRAHRITLHQRLFAQDGGYVTEPAVWLTTDDTGEGTVIAKMLYGGWPRDLRGNLCRFVVSAAYPVLTLDEFSVATCVDIARWSWAVRLGAMAGSRCRDWRLCREDIPAADWLAIEQLQAVRGPGETVWSLYG